MPELDPQTQEGVADALIFMGEFLHRKATDPEFAASLEAQVIEGNPITVRPGPPPVEQWVADQISGAEKNKEKWKRNALTPKVNPLDAAIAAEPYYEEQVKKALDGKHYSKGLGQVTLAELGAAIEATDPSDYAKGISKRKPKITKKVSQLRPLHEARAAYVDQVKPDTAEHRKERMNRNYDAMIAVGVAMKTAATTIAVS